MLYLRPNCVSGSEDVSPARQHAIDVDAVREEFEVASEKVDPTGKLGRLDWTGLAYAVYYS